MKAFPRVGVLTLISLCAVLVPGAAATQASAASFTPAPGLYTVDTSALTLTGPGTSITGVDQGGIAVFSFDSIDIPAGVEIEAAGGRPLEFKSAGAFTLSGLIKASGFDATSITAGPNPGGPGGGAGGADGTQAGSGPGGGGTGAEYVDGGGGGGFGGAGASGGKSISPVGVAGGAGGGVYGNLNAALQGGSGGAGGTQPSHPPVVGGGGGGGAVALFGASLTISSTGEVLAEGGNGSGGDFGASGGGSGGGILLHANAINMAGTLSAAGGQGGTGGCCGDGGGGGGGRIAYQYSTSLSKTGPNDVSGGTSGTSGAFGSGAPGEAAGAPGVITSVQGATATTGAAGSLSSVSATLNGTVNPNGRATTYRFEYGTTSAYGTVAPVPNGAVGSDSAGHALSLAVANLKPKTTYHYRVVAVDSLGFTAAGADVSFTTKPFSGVKIGKKAGVKKGAARLKLSSEVACKGKVMLSTKVKGAKGKPKTKKLGSASFSLQGGKARTVKVHLSAGGLALLEKSGSIKVKAAAKASVSGVSKTTKRTVTLKLAKKH